MLNILGGFQTLNHNLYNIQNGFSDKSYGHHGMLYHGKITYFNEDLVKQTKPFLHTR